MKATDFVAMAKRIADDFQTLYVQGCLGDLMTPHKKERYTTSQHLPFNRHPSRLEKIMNTPEDVYGFDCVTLIKCILWGWKDADGVDYGGAVYRSNGLDDLSINELRGACTYYSTAFSDIQPGEMLFDEKGNHCGIYEGNGKAIECTHRGRHPDQAAKGWEDGVQHTSVYNIAGPGDDHGRYWFAHGRLPWVEYEQPEQPEKTEKTFSINVPYMRLGSRGEPVAAWQRLLVLNGLDTGAVDGIYGPKTKKATEELQERVGVTVDGIVGPDTLSAALGV